MLGAGNCFASFGTFARPMRDVHRVLRVCTTPGHLNRSDVAFLEESPPAQICLSFKSAEVVQNWRGTGVTCSATT